MKKIFTLLTAFAMTATFASAEIFTVKGPNDGIIGQGAVLDNTGSAIVVTSISATTAKNKDMLKTANDKFADGTLANAFCKSSIKFRLDAAPTVENPDGTANAGSTAFKIVVKEDIKALNLYAEAAAGMRSFNLFNRATGEITTKSFTTVKGTDPAVAGTNIGYIATWSDVVAGEYTLYLTGFGGGFCGITYETAGSPAPISWSEKSQTIQLGSEYTLPTFSNTDPEIAVSFVSSNPEVATVSENGEISLVGNGVGTAVITATYEGEKYDKTEVSCEITVISTVDPEFAFSAAEATVIFGGDMSALPVLNMSEGITADEVKYSFSDNNYVAEYKNGSISAIAPGKVVVTASFAGNDKYNAATASYILTVNRESYTVVESEGVVYAYDASVMVIGKDASDKDIFATEATYADGLKVALPTGKQLQPLPGTMTVNGQAYTPFKLSNGAELKIDAPEGKIIESITVYSVVNYNRPGKNYASRAPYWETLNGVSVEKTADNVMVNFVDMENWGETPDVVSFEVNAASTTIKNKGEQPAVVLVIKYVEEAPAEIAAPTHNQEGETVKVNGSQEVVFTPAADHHVVYTYFEAATAPEVETQAAAETVEHEGKTFTLAADNKVTVNKSGTLYYFAMDPATEVKSPVNSIAFDVTTGIADIDVDSENAPVEYFNMQGIRVANPQNGLYIRRQGNKVEKVYVK